MNLVERFGRRGVVLILLGFPWIFYGAGIIEQNRDRFSPPGVVGPLHFMDNRWWGLMWIAGGIFAIGTGLLRRAARRYRLFRDEIGFNGLIIPPLIWTLVYTWSWILDLTTDHMYGLQNGYWAALIFGSYILLVSFIARWPDLDPPTMRDIENENTWEDTE